jgi:hypothetical protein
MMSDADNSVMVGHAKRQDDHHQRFQMSVIKVRKVALIVWLCVPEPALFPYLRFFLVFARKASTHHSGMPVFREEHEQIW